MTPTGSALRERLGQLAGCEDVGLAETALLLAALDQPGPMEPALASLDRLAAALKREQGVGQQAAALASLLSEWHGFRLDDQDNDLSANLFWVLEHHQGTPEILALLWLEVARRAGWNAQALAFPGCLLVRLEDEDGNRIIIDPALGGHVLTAFDLRAQLKAMAGLAAELEPRLFAPLSNRDILLRLQNEVKLRVLRSGRVTAAVAIVEAMLLFAPDQTALWREAGMMHMRLDNLPAAIAALEQFVARAGNSPARRRTQLLLQEIRARMI
ncbi:MAG: transglutaminase-like domain-containing protein [Magnetospirillum sp.]|nr:transglutaminase-like domain-containing protein [Magnetospirillum sp.]